MGWESARAVPIMPRMFDHDDRRLRRSALALMSAAALAAAVAGCGGGSSSGSSSGGSTTRTTKPPANAKHLLDKAMRNGAKLQSIANACAKSAGHDKAALTACLKDHGLQVGSENTPLDKCLKDAGEDVGKVLACSKQVG